jgi:hypothetical protein
MASDIGNERVLEALARTVPGPPAVDLRGPAGTAPAAVSGQRYVELGELGRGGLGVVLEVFDQDLRRRVALKRPQPGLHRAALGAVVREAQITAQLEHPGLPSVHALGLDADGHPFFTMTRLRGESLAALVGRRESDPEARAQLTTTRALRIVEQVGYALAFAHSHGVIHRDVKPANIMLGEFGEVRLVDWGIAKLVGLPDDVDPEAAVTVATRAAETRTGTFVGTPGYAAPEQAEGRTDLDPRADVYALGAVLYELLAGRPPIDAPTVAALIEDTRAGRIPPLATLAPVSDALAAIVHKALATRREDRYPGVLELLADLEALQEGRHVTALHEGFARWVGRWYGSRSPRLARMTNRDVDFMCGSCSFIGGAIGAALVHYHVPYAAEAAVVSLVVGLLMAIPPLYTALRRERPDDPGAAGRHPTGRASARPSSGSTAPAPSAVDATGPTAAAPDASAATMAASDETGPGRHPDPNGAGGGVS